MYEGWRDGRGFLSRVLFLSDHALEPGALGSCLRSDTSALGNCVSNEDVLAACSAPSLLESDAFGFGFNCALRSLLLAQFFPKICLSTSRYFLWFPASHLSLCSLISMFPPGNPCSYLPSYQPAIQLQFFWCALIIAHLRMRLPLCF